MKLENSDSKPGTGLIFNIQRFSVHDGPGIRTTVFMKGCPLHCWWCSNPESQAFQPDLMVRDALCKECGACVEACPQGAISFSRRSGRKIDRARCNRCMACVSACVYQSLAVCGRSVSLEEILEEALRDRMFYKNSGGGVTISGGEALSQSRFVFSLLERCKAEGLHTVLDTSGFAPWKALESLLPLTDLLLYDIKHLDSVEHERTTGAGNEIILDNLEKAAGRVPIWIRLPLIAGFNDSPDHIGKIALMTRNLKVQKISFLPYHEGGRSKSDQLGQPDPMPDAASPSDEQLRRLQDIVEGQGIKADIGR